MERAKECFVTPGVMLACAAATAAGLIKSITSQQLWGGWLALLVALAGAFALLGTAGMVLVERRGGRRIEIVLALMFATGAAAVVISRGAAFLLLMPLITYGVLFLSPLGAAALAGASSAVTIAVAASVLSTGELIKEVAIWCASLAFVLVVSRMLLVQHRLAGELAELARANERNRIARDIHDGLGHYLTVVYVQLEAAHALLDREPQSARAALLKAQEMTREGLADVRRSVALLRGPSAAQRPLLAAIEKLASECRADGIDAAIRLSGTPRPLPEAVELTLYRAAQEALTNVRRHARASRLQIELAFAAGAGIRLRVEDDGVGAERPGQGFGLLGLRERAESVGGKLSVESSPGRGFVLQMELPG
jgi:signal transduction histidine kinase